MRKDLLEGLTKEQIAKEDVALSNGQLTSFAGGDLCSLEASFAQNARKYRDKAMRFLHGPAHVKAAMPQLHILIVTPVALS